jgi:acyl-CoA reductase-like NAD-dependent aldehyde dehydrogenase
MSALATDTGPGARAAALLDRDWRMLVGGELVSAAGGETYPTVSPHDGEVLARVPFAQREDVERAVAAARAAFPGWRALPLAERGAALGRVVEVLRAHAQELAIADAVDSGNPVSVMLGEVEMACEMLEYFRGVAWQLKGEVLPSPTRDWLLTRREPYGVVGRITAFNHPVLFAAQKLGAPLMAGNTLVLKVPEQTPLAPLLLGEILRDVLPPGVLNVVTGDGPTTGDALVRHPDVKRLALIGSVETGQRIQRSAAEAGVKHVSLELGGKNPLIVFPDADLDRASASAVGGMNFTRTAGQSCGSTSRLFLHEDVHDAVLERVVAGARAVRMGHPLDPDTQMGPLVSTRQYERTLGYVEAGLADGARLASGGGRPEGEEFAAGCYLEPTVFADVEDGMRIAREEIFGPVLSVLRFRERDDVIERANALPFGLTGGVWTRDLDTALDVADRLDTGYVWINGSSRHFMGAPFSGRKASGTDSEEGFEELVSYTQPKTISIGRG